MFEANALSKARAIARHTGLPAVADDSVLGVDALNGMPGVRSARWAGGHGARLGQPGTGLAEVADVPDSYLGAQFVCAAALVVPGSGPRALVIGDLEVEGRVLGPRGSGGFGDHPSCRRVQPDDGRDDRRSQGRDQPSRPRFPRATPFINLRPLARHRLRIMTDKRLAPGGRAPDFTLLDADGKEVSVAIRVSRPAGDRARPAAMTPGCTKEACHFWDSLADLNSGGHHRARHLARPACQAGQVPR